MAVNLWPLTSVDIRFSSPEDEDGSLGETMQVEKWFNALGSLGEDAASVLSSPDPSEWHPCKSDILTRPNADAALKVLLNGTLEDVKRAFVEPRDLLRWMADSIDDTPLISLCLACCAKCAKRKDNVEVLKHLFQLSPKYFMQLMGMVSLTIQGPITLLSWAVYRKQKEVISWMCESGVMTDAIFQNCFGSCAGSWMDGLGADGQMLSALDFVRGLPEKHGDYGRDPVFKEIETVLQEWLALSEEERRGRTEALFIDVLCKTIVSLSVASLPASGSVEIECLAVSGEAIGKINVDMSGAALFENIAEMLGKPKDSIVVIMPNGAALKYTDDLLPLIDMVSEKP